MYHTLQRPSLATCEWGRTLESGPADPRHCSPGNQTTPAVRVLQPHCALKCDAGKMTVSPVKQERSLAGRSSKNSHLKQANHHHIKRSDLTDRGKKLSLTRKLELSDHRDQGMTDFIYLYLSCSAHVYKHTHIFIC